MLGYKCFYRGKSCEVYALRTFDAQEIAAKIFKAKKKLRSNCNALRKRR
jgi:hypothetical protein